jgi:hypothetical protein
MQLARVEVTDEFGTVAQIVDLDMLSGLPDGQRGQLEDVADGLIKGLTAVLGGNEEHARHVAIAELARLAADEAAYERVAERRGVLPL